MAFFNNITQIRLNGTDMDEVHLNSNKVYPVPKPKLYLEYIESTGSQWINTLVYPTKFTRIELDFQYTANTVQDKTRLFGERRTWDNGFYLGTSANAAPSASYWYLFYDRYDSDGVGETDFNRHTVSLDTDCFKIDGSIVETFNNTTNLDTFAPICLFGAFDENANTPTTGIYKMYGCKLYENGVLVKDYVPVLDQNDVACLYDRVNKEFIYNSGTGDFSYSLTNSYTLINYLGTQNGAYPSSYINLNVSNLSNGSVAKFDMAITDISASYAYIYGVEDTFSPYNRTYLKRVYSSINNYELGAGSYNIFSTSNIALNQRVNVIVSTVKGNNYVKVDNVTCYSSVDSSGRSSGTYGLFTLIRGNSVMESNFYGKIYYFKLYDDQNNLIRDLIPVLKENTIPCMYDRVTKQFYLNSGTGTFDYE